MTVAGRKNPKVVTETVREAIRRMNQRTEHESAKFTLEVTEEAFADFRNQAMFAGQPVPKTQQVIDYLTNLKCDYSSFSSAWKNMYWEEKARFQEEGLVAALQSLWWKKESHRTLRGRRDETQHNKKRFIKQ